MGADGGSMGLVCEKKSKYMLLFECNGDYYINN